MSQWKDQLNEDVSRLSVTEQYNLAKALAANCGYQLVAEDTERSLEIKLLINRCKNEYVNVGSMADRKLFIEGLEKLL